MTEQQKQAIIESGKQYFRSIIIPNHLKNLNKLHLSSFDINPFLINYLAAFIKEDSQIIGLAKALVYPHIFDKVIDASNDIASVLCHFKPLISQPSLDLQFEDLVVGVLYGEKDNLSDYYKTIATHYPVLCGSDFWQHLTGDKNFYARLLKAMGEVLDLGDFEGSELIQAPIEEIAEEIKQECCLIL